MSETQSSSRKVLASMGGSLSDSNVNLSAETEEDNETPLSCPGNGEVERHQNRSDFVEVFKRKMRSEHLTGNIPASRSLPDLHSLGSVQRNLVEADERTNALQRKIKEQDETIKKLTAMNLKWQQYDKRKTRSFNKKEKQLESEIAQLKAQIHTTGDVTFTPAQKKRFDDNLQKEKDGLLHLVNAVKRNAQRNVFLARTREEESRKLMEETQAKLVDQVAETEVIRRELMDCTSRLQLATVINESQRARIEDLEGQITRHREETNRLNSNRVFLFSPEQEEHMNGFFRRVRDMSQRMCTAAQRRLLRSEANRIVTRLHFQEFIAAMDQETRDHTSRVASDQRLIASLNQTIRQLWQLLDFLLEERSLSAQMPEAVNEMVTSRYTFNSNNTVNEAAANTNSDRQLS